MSICTKIFTKTIKLSCNYIIKIKIKIKTIKNKLEYIFIEDVDLYWYFKKSNFKNRIDCKFYVKYKNNRKNIKNTFRVSCEQQKCKLNIAFYR